MATLTDTLVAGVGMLEGDLGTIWRFDAQAATSTGITDGLRETPGAVLHAMLGISTTLTPATHYNLTQAADALLSVAMNYGEPVALADGVGLGDTSVAAFAAYVIEKLGLAASMLPLALYGVTASANLRLRDAVIDFFGMSMAETLGVGETQIPVALRQGLVSEGLTLSFDVQPFMALRVVCADGLDITAEQALAMIFSGVIVDEIAIDLAFLDPGGGFTTWAMNTLTGAVSEYQNYAFNSFATAAGRSFGASADGLFELSGDDDDGDPIVAQLRSGYLQFGGTQLSRLKEAYIAARGTGDVVLKIVTAEGQTYIYTATLQNMKNIKVPMGKGQRARFFSWELVTEGQDFDLVSLEFVPIVVQRRV